MGRTIYGCYHGTVDGLKGHDGMHGCPGAVLAQMSDMGRFDHQCHPLVLIYQCQEEAIKGFGLGV